MIWRPKSKSTLANLLNDYTATARAALKSHAPPHLGRWSIYAAATGAALASATSAEANIITGSFNNLTISAPQSNANNVTQRLTLRTAGGAALATLGATVETFHFAFTGGHFTGSNAGLRDWSSKGKFFTSGNKIRQFSKSQLISGSHSGVAAWMVTGRVGSNAGNPIDVRAGQFAAGVPAMPDSNSATATPAGSRSPGAARLATH